MDNQVNITMYLSSFPIGIRKKVDVGMGSGQASSFNYIEHRKTDAVPNPI
jgi:hypothetical protein